MPMLALLASVVLAAGDAVPLESQCAESLREARQNVASGRRGRGLATLDSLVMKDGVTVAIEASGASEACVVRGIQTWNDALGEDLFRRRSSGGSADVTVRFVRSLSAMGGDVQGMVQADREITWSERTHSYRLKGTIFVRDNVDGRPLRADEIVNVVAHETGHLLGLADVPGRDRLMGPMIVGSPKCAPRPEEAETVRAYRALVRRCYPSE